MLERKENVEKEPGTEQLLALPSGYREKVMTPEMILKAALKSQRRKQQADEKREKDKKKTMERLLRKQESKAGKLSSRNRGTRRSIPLATYINTINGIYVTLPPNIPLPLSSKKFVNPSPIKLCGVTGCNNSKKYSCSKTGVPLCSLQCYSKNLSGNVS
uniref:INO80 complex subunit B-like conserved region domain-containing protein n=2 Tax=Clastoptera arizonana TaxID=38151 RepID=A0A1B6E999_9HEMI